jgi:hypothetical protein
MYCTYIDRSGLLNARILGTHRALPQADLRTASWEPSSHSSLLVYPECWGVVEAPCNTVSSPGCPEGRPRPWVRAAHGLKLVGNTWLRSVGTISVSILSRRRHSPKSRWSFRISFDHEVIRQAGPALQMHVLDLFQENEAVCKSSLYVWVHWISGP